ncbi:MULTISPECIES: hypothetical protein [unclassified Psychrobacillus]|uniref:hypothetical protein n=1 Tax=unclassified Psychrobacillus TaxID=2636677 RepID=UPI0030F71F42
MKNWALDKEVLLLLLFGATGAFGVGISMIFGYFFISYPIILFFIFIPMTILGALYIILFGWITSKFDISYDL